MLATIRDDMWNVLNRQQINSKRWDYSDIPGGGHKAIQGPADMVEGGHYLRKAPNPHHAKYEKIPSGTAIVIQWAQVEQNFYNIECQIMTERT